jgi:hypothetical protein
MIPEDIYKRYHGFPNPYREILKEEDSVIAYEYSDQVPSWNLEYVFPAKDYPRELIKKAIEDSERKGYYSFYSLCPAEDFKNHVQQIESIDDRYDIIVEEKIPPNEKSINTLYWDWILKTISRPQEHWIILHILPSKYRDRE